MSLFLTKYQQILAAFFWLSLTLSTYWYYGPHYLQIIPAFMTILMAFGYVYFGPQTLAYKYAKNGDIHAAKRIIESITNIDALSSKKRAYLYFAKGLVSDANGQSSLAEESFRKAVEDNKLLEEDMVIAHLELARLCFLRGDEEGSSSQVFFAKSFQSPKKMVSEIEKFENSLSFESTDLEPRFLFYSDSTDTDESDRVVEDLNISSTDQRYK